MTEKSKPEHIEVTGPQVLEGEVVEPPSIDERMPHPLTKALDQIANLDPDNFKVHPLHEIARQLEIDDRKHTEPMKCIAEIQRDIADIENLHVLHLDKISNVRKLSNPHFQNIKREMKRLKSILEVPE